MLAAAITAKATVIVTNNLADFPSSSLEPHGIEALHPDDFVVRLLDGGPERVVAAARDHLASLKRPPKTVVEYLAILDRNGFTATAAALRQFAAAL